MTNKNSRTRRPELRQAAEDSGIQPQQPLQAIRETCVECSGGSRAEVARCTARSCPLWPFRFGLDPWRKPATDAQRQASVRNARRNLQ
jgi:hypothetical protein